MPLKTWFLSLAILNCHPIHSSSTHVLQLWIFSLNCMSPALDCWVTIAIRSFEGRRIYSILRFILFYFKIWEKMAQWMSRAIYLLIPKLLSPWICVCKESHWFLMNFVPNPQTTSRIKRSFWPIYLGIRSGLMVYMSSSLQWVRVRNHNSFPIPRHMLEPSSLSWFCALLISFVVRLFVFFFCRIHLNTCVSKKEN